MTYSLVLAVPAARLVGAATASCSLGVGNAVPFVRPGVGAVVSQAWTNRSLRGRLLESLAAGGSPDEAVAVIPDIDPEHALRQVGLVDGQGRSAVHTGVRCSAWAGSLSLAGAANGVACANLVAGERVVETMARVVGSGAPPADAAGLADLMLAALRGGRDAGGDLRGQQSAAVIVGEGAPHAWFPPDLAVDLRVDDHADPLAELGRLLELLRPRTA